MLLLTLFCVMFPAGASNSASAQKSVVTQEAASNTIPVIQGSETSKTHQNSYQWVLQLIASRFIGEGESMVNMHRRLLDAELSMPPAYGNNTRESFISDANFDANMVIILAALLCALICALGLNSIVRCALRCSRRFSPQTNEQTASRGLKKRHLSQIPVKVYGSGVNIPATECPICLGEFEKGDRVRMLPKCNHGFHVRCIDTWLLSHSSCPNCRHSLLEKSTISSSNEMSEGGGGGGGGGGVNGARPPEEGSDRQGNVVVVVEQAS